MPQEMSIQHVPDQASWSIQPTFQHVGYPAMSFSIVPIGYHLESCVLPLHHHHPPHPPPHHHFPEQHHPSYSTFPNSYDSTVIYSIHHHKPNNWHTHPNSK